MTTTTTRAPAARKAAHANLRISQGLDTALAKTAKKIKISKSVLVKEALLTYMEDIDDIQVLQDRKNEPSATLADVRKRLGL
jgi:predicted DNA-binding protein